MDKLDIQKKAVSTFNQTWDYIEKKERTPKENLEMINLAYQSKYYWSLVGKALNFVRSDWQVSRVYAESNLLEASLYYAGQCLENTLRLELKDFDLFFAYEANVRVHHLQQNLEKRDEFVKLAIGSLESIEKQSDKDYCREELEKIMNM